MEKDKIKKKIVTSATAASMLIGGIFSPPPENVDLSSPNVDAPSAYEMVMSDTVDNDDDLFEVPGEEKKKGKFAKRVAIAVPIIIVSWAAGIGICIFMSTILNSIMSVVFSWFITIILGIITYATVSKVMFPNLKLKQILRAKPLLIIIGVSTVFTIIIKLILR